MDWHLCPVPPWVKLPAWYLLDAISKNVNEPYARLFASVITSLFLESYDSVDPNTRGKMEEMLLTWRTGSPSRRELFGIGPQLAIERTIWGSGSSGEVRSSRHSTSARRSKAPHQSSFNAAVTIISPSQVISEIEVALGQMNHALHVNPYDSQAQNHTSVLQQLRAVVQSGVSQEELRQILTQLRSMSRPSSAQSSVTPAPADEYTSSSSVHLQAASGQHSTPSVLSQPQSEQSSSSPEFFEGSSPSGPQMPPPTVTSASVPSIPTITSLVNTLIKAGVVSAPGSTSTGSKSVTPEHVKEAITDVKVNNRVDSGREQDRVYRDAILSQGIKLNSTDINRRRPDISYVYGRLPVQCKQCGVRFADSVMGKKNMQEHLDMHFKQNRKANESVGRGHSRSWFVALEDWIQNNGKGKSSAGPWRPSNIKSAATADAAKREAELRAQSVVVPPGDEAKTVDCPICKEILKSEFQEDEEEWVWKNAVDVDGRIYHATCRAEALSSTTALTAKLRLGFANNSPSRSVTPEVSSAPLSRMTPPRSSMASVPARLKSDSPKGSGGMKRKISSVDGAVGTSGNAGVGGDGPPPSKKIVISVSV
ncbi:uncharacterized protein STEHIDRAFT_167626 [Stereum hirsutum FP-91666 SS1]|uniref:uncharacterized protein n=1 Tax=Stereum hirsutum (strain FP-91666) TaxID=721885 RepID=UPI000440C8DD|nr:uncharacterized protein STEHIDRAFT_167626 [Stereum hirsutum FP-91666 SS1]EIM88315.1 hypothetical protein STEHIDRAFT_167626 [Stereum hirsutum FP-91666 SS1]